MNITPASERLTTQSSLIVHSSIGSNILILSSTAALIAFTFILFLRLIGMLLVRFQVDHAPARPETRMRSQRTIP